MRLVSGFIVGLGLAVAQGCGAKTTFACGDDSDCTLSGQAGVCADDGNCAYPSDGCASGWAYPEGAPGGLAGMCVDVGMGTGGSSSTGTNDPQTDTTAAGDSTSGTSADSATTQSVSASGDSTGGGVATDTMSVTDSSGSSGTTGTMGCDLFELTPAADAFMATTCGGTECATLNFGATLLHAVGSDVGGGGAVFALRFAGRQVPLQQLSGAPVTLRLFVGDATIQGGDVEVWALDGNYAWAEGVQDGEPAAMGESCWDFAIHDNTPWPGEGPISAATTLLGSNAMPPAPDGTLEIALDADAVLTAYSNGADSVLVVSGAQQEALTVYSRESDLPPVLVFGGC